MRQRRHETVWALLLILVCAGSALGQNYPPSIPDAKVKTFKTVDGVELNAWIFLPDGHQASDSRPAMVFFFGGGFTRGTPAHFERQARALRAHGMVTVLADYRVRDRHDTRPSSAVEDAKSAIRWVRQHAGEMGIDPDRIGAAGGSAGGHLAAATATLPGFDGSGEDVSISSAPDALVLFNPVVIVAAVDGVFDPPERYLELMGAGALYGLSPFHHVGGDTPPTLIMHGTEDESVPYPTVVAYCNRVVERGGECEVVTYEGAAHGFFNNAYYYPTLHQMLRFLESLGWFEL